MLAVLAVVISLVLLIYLGYKGWSIVLVAPVLALTAVILTGLFSGAEIHPLATYTETFMSNMAGYVKSYFPFFLLGAIFGKMMEVTGSANSIANFITKKLGPGKELWAVVLSCAVITYGGVSLFVAAFAIYPIGAAMFRQANLPKRMLPPCIALGAFTFTMTAIPGTPQIQNTIPMKYFGTDAFAAPILGIVAACIMLFGGMWWISSRLKKAVKAGEGYGDHVENLVQVDEKDLPSFTVAILPILFVIIVNLVLSKVVFAGQDPAWLTEQYNTTMASVMGTWALIVALIVGILLCLFMNWKRIAQQGGVIKVFKDGTQGSFLAVLNTASEVGYGNVIKTLAGYSIIAAALMGISGNPLITGAISTSVLAGITGSASGGMSIALSSFADQLMAQADSMGMSYEALHRVVAVASGGLDTLPHNGAVITLLAITGMTHKDCYVNIGMCTVVIPAIACVAIIILATFGIC